MATKIRNRSIVIPVHYYQNNNGSVTEANESVTRNYTETVIGSSVPAWQYKIAHLQSATSSYTRSGGVTFENGGYTLSASVPRIGKGSYVERLSGIPIALPPSPSDITKAYELALGNFLTNASNVIAPLKGGTVIGELRETLRMIRNPASALRDGFSSYFKRARRLTARRRPKLRKVLSNTWLEYVYGWRPLIEDLKSGVEAYRKLKDSYETVRAFGMGTSSGTPVLFQENGGHANYLRYVENRITTLSSVVKFKGVCKAWPDGIQTSSAERLQVVLGFNLADFVPTVWELIPYSFVVDMFTNVGDILNAGHGLNSTWVWLSRSTKTTRAVTVSRRVNLPEFLRFAGESARASESGGPSKLSVWNYSRGTPTLRLPSLVFELPSSPWSWANLLALLSSKAG